MSRIHLAAITLSVACLGMAARATAKIDPCNSEAPGLITLVGLGADGSADSLGSFAVNVRDFNNVPVQNSRVVLDFSGCGDIRLCANQHDLNVTVNCAAHSISALTNVNGQATFRVIGCAADLGGSPGSLGPCLNVYADGVFVGSPGCSGAHRVAALDQNGGGVNGADFSPFLADYFSGQNYARSDYDGDGIVGGNDLSLWLAAFFAGGSAVSGGASCP
jgi:hypothetical protein